MTSPYLEREAKKLGIRPFQAATELPLLDAAILDGYVPPNGENFWDEFDDPYMSAEDYTGRGRIWLAMIVGTIVFWGFVGWWVL